MNYTDTFIAASEDCRAAGAIPTKEGSIAAVHYRLLAIEPYRHTQEDVLYVSSASARKGEPEDRAAFFTKSLACLRCSPLVKNYGWGIHFDAEGRAAAYAGGTDEYHKFSNDASLKQTRGMRSRKA